MIELNGRIVLKAVMANLTGVGAVINRLKTHYKVPEQEINRNSLLGILGKLIEIGLVEVRQEGNLMLYKKIPRALDQLPADFDRKLTYDPTPREDVMLPPLVEAPFPEGTGSTS